MSFTKNLFLLSIVLCPWSFPVLSQSLSMLQTGGGPEDMVIDSLASPPRLLVSCCSRRPEYTRYGEIEAVDPVAGTRFAMKRTGEPDGLVFRPHGISLAQAGEIQYLYVISHDDIHRTHCVIKYEVDGDRLIFIERFESRLLVSPNALQAYPDGSFLVCNDAGKPGDKKELILGLKRGNILFYDGLGNFTIAARELGMPCGMNAIGRKVYVSATRENCLWSYDLDEGQLTGKKEVCSIKGPDNIRVYNGNLLVTSHCKTMKFVGHTKSRSKPSPSLVLEINPATGRSTRLFYDDGTTYSAASVAVVFQGRLIMGQIFEPFIALAGTVK